ncbi:TPA: DUF551 domain-containing protein [Escherichia coli]|uniref:hypothetical protein n=1 Tax=Enterobacteriaceae TaxID=543 RepID=UPI0009738F18|nr:MULTISPECIES: hypothetical protein [Enterobacteriaceae]APY49690.1 hypothetical protein LFZ7_05315 [Salmonella enterica subsp. enterica serovar Crossness str. 1422-74]MCU7749051.1 DUF551 domain-containing protein [Enterobacter hormaechei]HAI5190588.1 DUF551 domain-containing protein [Escherichia coli]HAY4579910.1 DUF551 domain-containing protein [Escherichia coli]
MSTITRELAKLFRKITNSEIDAEGNAHVVLSPADSLLINNARIALASLEAEPVAWAHRLINKRNGVVHPWVYGSAEACPSEGDIFNIEVMPLYTVPPAPVSVPAAMEMDDDFDSAFEHGKAVGWNAYRAAMLQAEPVSNSDELPLDYLQGHKDGLEWAAQLAEANHPQTGDWLYDDPIDLARAIRKGPDMPTVQGGNSPVIPDDVRRMDWLVSKTVDVREPMVYGSHSLFWSQTITDEEDDYHATKLREQIDAAMAAEQAAAPQQEAE